MRYRLRCAGVIGLWHEHTFTIDGIWSLEFATVQVELTNNGTILGDPHKVEGQYIAQFTSGDVFHVPPDTQLNYRLRRNGAVTPWQGITFGSAENSWELNCDVDTDGDGVLDQIDPCPVDTNKLEPGICGCGVADPDTDSDGSPDCIDAVPLTRRKSNPACAVVA